MMADEDSVDTIATTDVVDAPVAVPVEKKSRRPRRTKAEIEAAKLIAREKTSKNPRVKRVPKVADAGRRTGADDAFATGEVHSTNGNTADDMAELLHLEEENKSLRKQLANKLRAENAELRKRLGTTGAT